MKAPIRNTRGRERNPRWLRPLLHRRTRRCDPTEQLLTLGVPEDRIYIDRGFSGTTRRNRAGLDQALAAVWNGSVFTVTKFDRFARNMAEANDILTGLSGCGVLFGLGASVYDWNDPFGRLFLQTLAMVAEFEANLGHMRTREGMALAKKNGKLKGKQPKLREPARRSIRRRYAEGEVSLADLATEYSVGRSTIHGIVHGPETSKVGRSHAEARRQHFARDHSQRQPLFLGTNPGVRPQERQGYRRRHRHR
ncbi:recombinase family protein [Nonomuraea angiospora]|uniref:recombinase family protein n=1 Tax=Nonomuraea angiospora TaxID=46172 RepID=UPI0029B93A04|nr:recombinase family protein [Nonomuraea angiospora]MDX3103454.1 recombinase family protein [Nonomuraea angiospora]